MPCRKGRLQDEQYDKIQSNYTELVKDIKYDPMGLARSLFQYQVFDDDDLEKIKREERRDDGGKADAAAKLLDILLNCGSMAYDYFMKALNDNKYYNALFRLEPGFKRVEEHSTTSDRHVYGYLKKESGIFQPSGIPPIQGNIRTYSQLDKKNEDSPRLRTMKDNTINILHYVNGENFVKTRAFEEGLKILKNHSVLGIIGAAGDGKTSLSMMIAYQFIQDNQQYTPLMIDELDDLNHASFNDDKYLLIIDDMYGKFNTLKDRTDKWPKKFENFRIRKEKGQLAFVYIMRDYIYNSSKYQLDRYRLFSENTTQIFLHKGDFSLTEEEKRQFLDFYKISSDTIISKIKGCFGFPAISSVCGKLKNESLPINLVSSHDFLLAELKTFWKENKDIYSTLLMVFCLHSVREEDLKLDCPKGVRELVNKIIENVYNDFNLNFAKENVRELSETFIQFVERNYKKTFSLRDFVEAPFLYHFSEKCMEMALEYCSFELLISLTTTTGQPENQFIIVHKKYYNYFSLRCLKELKMKNTGIFLHPAFLDNKFLSEFLTMDEVQVLLFDIETISLGQIQGIDECGNFVHYISLYGDLECLSTVLGNFKEHTNEKTNMNWDVIGLAAISMIEPIEKLNFLRQHNYGDIVSLPHQAVYSGRFDVVQHVASFTVFDPKSLDNKSRTILHNACDSNHDVVEIIDFLIENGFDVNAKDGDGSTPLHLAVHQGRELNVSVLISRGASVSALDNNGRSPAHVLCTVDDGRNDINVSGILNQLIEAGSPINSSDQRGRTPLQEAVFYVNRNWIQSLLKIKNIMVDMADEIFLSIMYPASLLLDNTLFISILDEVKRRQLKIDKMILFNCCGSLENLKALRSAGVDFHVTDPDEQFSSLLQRSCIRGTVEIVKYLIDEIGLDINYTDMYGQTAATYCCISKITPVEKMKFLSLKGGNLDVVDDDNLSLLHHSCRQGTTETVKFLVNEIGLDGNKKDINGLTPVAYCVVSELNPVDKLKFLSSKGGKLDVVDNDNLSLLHHSCRHGITNTVKFLVNEIGLDGNKKDINGATPVAHCALSEINPVDKLKFLLSKGCKLDVVDNDGRTLLHHSCFAGTLATVKYLVNEIKLDVKLMDINGFTPVACCALSEINPVDKLKFLSSKGGNLDVVDNDNLSLLHHSCREGTTETVKFLVNEIGLDGNKKDINGLTPVAYCVVSELNPVDKLKFLSLKGCKLDVVDNDNRSLLHHSCREGIIETVNFLVNEIRLVVNRKDINDVTPTLACALSEINPVDKLKFLSLNGGKLDVVDNDNKSLLHHSCREGTTNTVKFLVNEIGLDGNKKDINGLTPVAYCALSEINPVDKLKFLSLKAGKLDVVDNDNQSLLHHSCREGTTNTVKFLVNEIGLDGNKKDINGLTPVAYCALSEINPVDKLKFLSLKGGKLDVVDNDNKSLLHHSCRQGTTETVKYLVNEIGLDINQKDINGLTPVAHCVVSELNPVDKLKFLSSKGGELDVVDNNNLSLLHHSCRGGTTETVKFLVNEIGLDGNKKDINGLTHVAHCVVSKLNPVDKLKFLSSKGGELDIVDNKNRSLLHLSCRGGITNTVKFFVNEIGLDGNKKDINGLTPVAYCALSEINPVDKLKFLSLKGGKLDVVDNDNKSLLHHSCREGTTETVKYLVNKIQLDVNKTNINGATPTMACAVSDINPVEKLKFLLSKGCKLDVVDNRNCSLLHHSCRDGTLATVKYLVNEMKLDVNKIGRSELPPTVYCIMSRINPVDKLKFLLSKGGTLDIQGSNTCTLLGLCCKQGTVETLTFLINEMGLDMHTLYIGLNMHPFTISDARISQNILLFQCFETDFQQMEKLNFLVSKGAEITIFRPYKDFFKDDFDNCTS